MSATEKTTISSSAARFAASARKRGAKSEASSASPDQKPSGDRAAEHAMGQNTLADFRPSDLLATAGTLYLQAWKQPFAVARASVGFWSEIGKVATGRSELAPAPGDRRFSDPMWRENPVYAGLMKSYLAMSDAMANYAASSGLPKQQAERAQFLLAQVSDALAPTNYLLGNPAALRRARETKGLSLLKGVKNLAGDVWKRRPIPQQVDESAFKIGKNLAATPGSVVLRTEMFELIQYAPQTEQVYQRPILVVPSIVNKYYVFDLAPDRSILEYYVKQGLTVFVMAWRNPQKQHDRWGFPDYQDAIEAAIDAACEITHMPDVNLWAVCGAGPVVVSLAGYFAAMNIRKINSLLLVVSPLDMKAMTNAPGIGAFATQDDAKAEAAIKRKLKHKRISAREFTLLFAMLRSNELIWHYWINNYLLGDTPPAFDVLYWNGDGTGMTAEFNADLSEFVDVNPLVEPGAMKVRGESIAPLSELGFDSYVLGAANDHLCVWQGVYKSAQLLGPRAQFVLGNSGHIQTIVCPPGNPKASFSTNEALPPTPEEWIEGSTRNTGSWWDHGVAWTITHAGDRVPSPTEQGSARHPPLGKAPGTYVHERA